MDLTRRRRPARHTSELLPRLEDLVRDGVDQTDGRKRAADDGADARHEVVPRRPPIFGLLLFFLHED